MRACCPMAGSSSWTSHTGSSIRFFEIKNINAIVHPMSHIPPNYYGVFEDNDLSKRLIAIANYDNDVPEYWEWSGQGLFPFDASNEAYKLGVNYMIYGPHALTVLRISVKVFIVHAVGLALTVLGIVRSGERPPVLVYQFILAYALRLVTIRVMQQALARNTPALTASVASLTTTPARENSHRPSEMKSRSSCRVPDVSRDAPLLRRAGVCAHQTSTPGTRSMSTGRQ